MRPVSWHNELDLLTSDEKQLYGRPILGAAAEKQSFNYQSISFNLTSPPSDGDRRRALDRMEVLYGPVHTSLPDDWGSDGHILRVCAWIEKNSGDKSPGAIFLRQGCTSNKSVFEKYGLPAVARMSRDRMEQLILSSTVESRQLSDPLRLFIKNEPHKRAKIDEGRWRIICGVSLIDQIIDRVLYAHIERAAIREYENIPSKAGISWQYGGSDVFIRSYPDNIVYSSFDCRQFDITHAGWMFDDIRELNERLTLNPTPTWKQLSLNREQAVMYGSFSFSDGVVCEKILPGWEPSGRYTTLDANGKLVVYIRVLYDIKCGEPTDPQEICSMGDDTVQTVPRGASDVVDYYASCGIQLTIESEPGPFSAQNFCSKSFRLVLGRYVPIPMNWVKNCYSLICVERSSEQFLGDTLNNLCLEYAFHERFSELHSLLSKYYPAQCKSPAWYKNLVAGWEQLAPRS